MKKRLIALILCLAASVSVLAGCAGSIPADSEFKGQQITMYLSENVYNLDPAYAYSNDVTRSFVNLLFDTLFAIDENGKVTPSLAKSYNTEKTDEGFFMYIEIKDDARWSDNQPVTADDVIFAWKRLLNPNNSFESAFLLFDIKNARAFKTGEGVSKDDIGLTADGTLLTIEFEKEIDVDQFLFNLTSLALAPLREDIASKNDDWAKKPGVMTASGPFKLSKVGFYKDGEVKYEDINYSVKVVDPLTNKVLKDQNGNDLYTAATEPDLFNEQRINSFILERNLYYYRNAEDAEKLDVSVIPHRIIVDCSLSPEDIIEGYNKGIITYISDIPMSIRGEDVIKNNVKTYDSRSTSTLYLNHNAEITRTTSEGKTSVPLFANKAVRQALSMVIDREAIAKELVYAEAATGIVPTGVFDTNSAKTLFRSKADTASRYLTFNEKEAADLLKNVAKITPSEYSFSITVASYDEEHLYIASKVAEAWNKLGFKVTLNIRGTIANNDHHRDVASVPSDLCDDLWAEDIRSGNYDAAIADLVAIGADAYSVLAPFATQFSGQKLDMANTDNIEPAPHMTGFSSSSYNELLAKISNTKAADRSADLHTAEQTLVEEMPVIPVVFNKSAYVINDDILELNNKTLFWDKASELNYPIKFDSIEVKDYEEYELSCAKYIYEKYDEWKANSTSYFGVNFAAIDKESFVYTNSNYYYLYKDKYGTKGYEDWLNAKPEKDAAK